MERLIVKNFGPLKDVDIELNRINLFIGENGSGKSVLGKLVTIILDILNNSDEKNIRKNFVDLNISFFTKKTIIQFISKDIEIFSFKNETFSYKYYHEDIKKMLNLKERYTELENQKIESLTKIKKIKKSIILKFIDFLFRTNYNKELDSFEKKIEKSINETTSLEKDITEHNNKLQKYLTSKYIPAERNLISLFNKSIYSFLSADIALPKFIISFFSDFEKARNEIIELSFLDVKYIHAEKDKIYYNENEFLNLEHASSGIQSALPLYLTVKYFSNRHSSIIIEEPEQNLFPKAQKETVEYIVGELGVENTLFMMTHSPYILTALNNLILANDVKEQKGVEALKGIVEEKYCVPFEEVSAYSLVDGKSVSIMDKEDRIIGVNVIDSISDEVSETFDKLLAKLD